MTGNPSKYRNARGRWGLTRHSNSKLMYSLARSDDELEFGMVVVRMSLVTVALGPPAVAAAPTVIVDGFSGDGAASVVVTTGSALVYPALLQ